MVGFYRRVLADIPQLGLGDDDRDAAGNLVEFVLRVLGLVTT